MLSDWSDLAGEFEVVAGAVAGLDDGLAPVEAGGEHHAQAVHVGSTGALPLVQDLGSCAKNEKLEIFSIRVSVKIASKKIERD